MALETTSWPSVNLMCEWRRPFSGQSVRRGARGLKDVWTEGLCAGQRSKAATKEREKKMRKERSLAERLGEGEKSEGGGKEGWKKEWVNKEPWGEGGRREGEKEVRTDLRKGCGSNGEEGSRKGI